MFVKNVIMTETNLEEKILSTEKDLLIINELILCLGVME